MVVLATRLPCDAAGGHGISNSSFSNSRSRLRISSISCSPQYPNTHEHHTPPNHTKSKTIIAPTLHVSRRRHCKRARAQAQAHTTRAHLIPGGEAGAERGGGRVSRLSVPDGAGRRAAAGAAHLAAAWASLRRHRRRHRHRRKCCFASVRPLPSPKLPPLFARLSCLRLCVRVAVRFWLVPEMLLQFCCLLFLFCFGIGKAGKEVGKRPPPRIRRSQMYRWQLGRLGSAQKLVSRDDT